MVAVAQRYYTDEKQALTDIVTTGEMCIDLETTSLDPWSGRIGLYIIRSNDRTYLFRTAPSWLPLVLADPDTQNIGFNLKFDYQWMIKELGIECIRNTKDLFIDELLVSVERHGLSHNLQATIYRRLGVEIDKDIDHSAVDWTGELTEQQIHYALEDVQYLLPLKHELNNMLVDTQQERASQIEQDAVFPIAYMELNGVGINRLAWEAAIDTWEEYEDQAIDELDELDPNITNWNSPQQIIDAAQRIHHIKIPDTTYETINILADNYELFRRLKPQRKWAKRRESWGHKYLDTHVHKVTGRLQPEWRQLNTATGRMACAKPNLQQIPRDKSMRDLFTAKDGYVLASLDYQQIEMLTAAIMAPDKVLLDIFIKGEDTHRYVGNLITGKPEADITSDDRQIAKSANFGLLFGAGASTLQRYARKTYDVRLTEQECKKIIKVYFKRFNGLSLQRAYAFALFQHGKTMIEVRTLTGMRRILVGKHLKPTTWLNTRIQGTAGAGIKRALHRLNLAGYSKYLNIQVHDELLNEIPKEGADEHIAVIMQCMKYGMQDVLGKSAPVGVDCHVGQTWAE